MDNLASFTHGDDMNVKPTAPSRMTALRYYPWLVILLCAFFLFYKYVLQVYPSIMTSNLMSEFHLDGQGLGNLAAMFFYSYFVMQLFVGILLDKYSLRYLSACAILVASLGAFVFAMTHAVGGAHVGRLMMGLGAAFATVCYLKAAAVWFPADRFAFVGGLLATAAMLGAVFGEAPLSFVMSALHWRNTLILCGVVGVAIALLFVLLVRDHNPKAHLFASSNARSQDHAGTDRVSLKSVWRVLTRPHNWYLTFYSGLTFSPVAVFGGLWGNPFLREKYHLGPHMSASLVSLIFIGLAFGGPLLGYLSDRLDHRRRVMWFGNSLALLSLVLVLYVPHMPIWLLGVCLFCFGFAVGAFMLGFAMGKELNPLFMAATVIALINTGDAVLGAFTEPLVGHLLDMGWAGKIVDGAHYFTSSNYEKALSLLPIYLVLAMVMLCLLRRRASAKPQDKDTLSK